MRMCLLRNALVVRLLIRPPVVDSSDARDCFAAFFFFIVNSNLSRLN